MRTFESRLERIQNARQIEQRERAAGSVVRYAAWFTVGFAMFFLGLLGAPFGSLPWWLLYVLAMYAIAHGTMGLVMFVPLARQQVDTDEVAYTLHDESAPGQARLFVQDAPQHITVGDLGITNRERLMIGYTMERIGWRWSRDGVLKPASIINYAARYGAINEAVRQAGMVRHGYIRDEFRAWWVSPSPAIVDISTADGSDDDRSSGGELA